MGIADFSAVPEHLLSLHPMDQKNKDMTCAMNESKGTARSTILYTATEQHISWSLMIDSSPSHALSLVSCKYESGSAETPYKSRAAAKRGLISAEVAGIARPCPQSPLKEQDT